MTRRVAGPGRGHRYTLGDFPGVLARFDCGESVTALAASYGVRWHTLARLIRETGRRTDGGGSDQIAAAFAARRHWQRCRFKLDPAAARTVHAVADALDVPPEDVIVLAVRELARRRGLRTD